MFELTFLGTSAGVPTKYRNVTGLAITAKNPFAKSQDKNSPWLLIDCGEGTQHQILHTPLSLLQLRAICITHVHGDHCYGLAGVLASMAMGGRTAPLTLIAPQAIGKLLDTLTLTTELYFPYAIEFIAIESLKQGSLQQTNSEKVALENTASTIEKFSPVILTLNDNHQIKIDIIALSHRTPSHAFKLTQTIYHNQLNTEKLRAMNLPPSAIWGKLQAGNDVKLENGDTLTANAFVTSITENLSIIVAGDNDTPELMADFVEGVSLIVHEATYTTAIEHKILARDGEFNPMHCSAERIAIFAQKYHVPNLILTHFSGRYQPFNDVNEKTPNMGQIDAEVQRYFYGNYWLANDFDKFVVESETVKLGGHLKIATKDSR